MIRWIDRAHIIMFIASGHHLASRRAWIQSQPGSHFVSVNQTSKLLVWQSAQKPASERRQCRDYSVCSFVSNASPLYCHRANTNHRRCQRSSACERVSACACWLRMNRSFLNSTPLTCHAATEVMPIMKPNTITKLSFSAPRASVCVCVCVCVSWQFRDPESSEWEKWAKLWTFSCACAGGSACVSARVASDTGTRIERG